MSKLTQVRKALQENPNVTIVGALEKNHLPYRDGYWSHTIDFYVTPKGGVYTTKELQALMMSLVPGLVPTCRDDFYELGGGMKFGKLYFDEDIGIEAVYHKITLIDEDMFSSRGFVDGKRVIERTEKVQRRTWVRLFPNTQIAVAVLEGKNEAYSISESELAKHCRVVARLVNVFS